MLTEQVILDSLGEGLESRPAKDIIRRRGRMELLNFARQLVSSSSQGESGKWALITMSQIVSDRTQSIPMSTLISLVDLFFSGAFQLSPETCDKQATEAIFTAQLSLFYRVYPEIFPDMFSLTNPKSVLFQPPDRLFRFLDKITDSFSSSSSAGDNLVQMVQARMLEDGSQANIMTAIQRVFDPKNPAMCESVAGLVQWIDLKVLCAVSFQAEFMKWASNRETMMLALSIIQNVASIRADPAQVRQRLLVLNCFAILNDTGIYADEQMLGHVKSVLITVINAHRGIDEFPELMGILLKFIEYDLLDSASVNILADVLGTRKGLDTGVLFEKAMTMTIIRYESLSEVPETCESFVRALRLVIVIASKSGENGQVVFRDEVLKWLVSLPWTPVREIALNLFGKVYAELVTAKAIDSGVWKAQIVSIIEEFIRNGSEDILLMSCLSCMCERYQTFLVRRFEGAIPAPQRGVMLKYSVDRAVDETRNAFDGKLITAILETVNNVDDLPDSVIGDVIRLVGYLASQPSHSSQKLRGLVERFGERAMRYLVENKQANYSSDLVVLGCYLGWEYLAHAWPFVREVDETALTCMAEVSFGDEVTNVDQRREIFELFRQIFQCESLLTVFLFEADTHCVFVELSTKSRRVAALGMLRHGVIFLHDMPNLHLLQYFHTTCSWLKSRDCLDHSAEFVKVLWEAMAERSLLSQSTRATLFRASLPVFFTFVHRRASKPANSMKKQPTTCPLDAEAWGRYFEFLIHQIDPLSEVSPQKAEEIRKRVAKRIQEDTRIPSCIRTNAEGVRVWVNVLSMAVAGIGHGTAISKVNSSFNEFISDFGAPGSSAPPTPKVEEPAVEEPKVEEPLMGAGSFKF